MVQPTNLTRHDGLLAAISASLAGGAAAGWLSTIPTLAGVGAGGFVATLFVLTSLFVVPPT
ncbi:MAG: hypothetical protein RI568_12090 [Natronomonas sp.]|jgi:hypothetical protein|uniref:Uncharacterized protein n=1 Tax=Natronomonas salsuginis TaxID=2217661 RepID=A0A4U5JEI9_9EURY|nr:MULTISPECIES: hypothetical protein [Natronomonas]MDR9431421.1 hypothetical protein [Natronomonas sp.]TKR26288.1 hypothetical protein DM868_07300 [Natronomonas salsuginis]